MGIPEEKQDMKETDTLQCGQSLSCLCTDKYPHAEVAGLIHIYVFLQPKCKSQLLQSIKEACHYVPGDM